MKICLVFLYGALLSACGGAETVVQAPMITDAGADAMLSFPSQDAGDAGCHKEWTCDKVGDCPEKFHCELVCTELEYLK